MPSSDLMLILTLGTALVIILTAAFIFVMVQFKKESEIRHRMMNKLLDNHFRLRELASMIEKDKENDKYKFPDHLLSDLKEYSDSMINSIK